MMNGEILPRPHGNKFLTLAHWIYNNFLRCDHPAVARFRPLHLHRAHCVCVHCICAGCFAPGKRLQAHILKNKLRRKFSTSTRASVCNNFASAFCCHSGTKSVTAFANQFTWLICTFHSFSPLVQTDLRKCFFS